VSPVERAPFDQERGADTAGGAWVYAPVLEPPTVYLSEWSAFVSRWPDDTHPMTTHLVGFREATGKSRTSSSVIRFDVQRRRAVTISGKVYELVGPPNPESEAAFMRIQWLVVNECKYVRDATSQFLVSE
jgi:hypothetical protein